MREKVVAGDMVSAPVNRTTDRSGPLPESVTAEVGGQAKHLLYQIAGELSRPVRNLLLVRWICRSGAIWPATHGCRTGRFC